MNRASSLTCFQDPFVPLVVPPTILGGRPLCDFGRLLPETSTPSVVCDRPTDHRGPVCDWTSRTSAGPELRLGPPGPEDETRGDTTHPYRSVNFLRVDHPPVEHSLEFVTSRRK